MPAASLFPTPACSTHEHKSLCVPEQLQAERPSPVASGSGCNYAWPDPSSLVFSLCSCTLSWCMSARTHIGPPFPNHKLWSCRLRHWDHRCYHYCYGQSSRGPPLFWSMITTIVAQRWMIHEAVAPPVATNAELAQLQHDKEENTIQAVVEELLVMTYRLRDNMLLCCCHCYIQ